jgi:hypothetical protein
MHMMWQEKGLVDHLTQSSVHQVGSTETTCFDHFRGPSMDIIVINPVDTSSFFEKLHKTNSQATPDVITIIPQEGSMQEIHVDVQTSGVSSSLQTADGETRKELELVN